MDRETLSQYQVIKKEIAQLEEQIVVLDCKQTDAGIAKYNGMPGGGGGAGDPIGEGVAALDALRRKYRQKLAELYTRQEEIEDAIETLDGELRTLMRYRYITGHKWETICNLMGSKEYGPMDWMAVHRRHRKALEILADL